MNNFLKEYQDFYKTLKTLPASISKQVVGDLSRLIIEKYMDLYDLISEQNCNCKCSVQTDSSSQMEDINNLLEQLDHIKNENIKKLYINAIRREKGESSKVKNEGEVIYERPSEEQLRRARELYKQV